MLVICKHALVQGDLVLEEGENRLAEPLSPAVQEFINGLVQVGFAEVVEEEGAPVGDGAAGTELVAKASDLELAPEPGPPLEPQSATPNLQRPAEESSAGQDLQLPKGPRRAPRRASAG